MLCIYHSYTTGNTPYFSSFQHKERVMWEKMINDPGIPGRPERLHIFPAPFRSTPLLKRTGQLSG